MWYPLNGSYRVTERRYRVPPVGTYLEEISKISEGLVAPVSAVAFCR
jgi:hypothetical protein